jgi:predicted nucleotidyltransferase component of viral defense system
MNDAIRQMLGRYRLETLDDHVRALREILQELALLGLWRSKFFEHAAFYGGTALRVLHGLDRFSEDLDFSLLASDGDFTLARFTSALEAELRAFGFEVRIAEKEKRHASAIKSAFLKADTLRQLIEIRTPAGVVRTLPRGQVLKIRLEIDTSPPPGFETEVRFLLNPIPFPVRAFALPDLFAGKMHAVLCRRWKGRVNGRDWYDLVWFAGRHPALHLSHLQARMVQSGDWPADARLTSGAFRSRLVQAIHSVDLNQARQEVAPFVTHVDALSAWSVPFFLDVASRIVITEG